MKNTSVQRNLARPLLLGTLLALGAVVLWALGIGVVESVIEQWMPRQINEQIAITRDGDILIVQYGSGEAIYRTLKGEPITDQAHLKEASTGSTSPRSQRNANSEVDDWASWIVGFRDTRLPPTYWYLVSENHPGGRGYFAGFDSRSKQAVGYLGLAGFRSDVPPLSEQFDGNAETAGANGRRGLEPDQTGSTIPYVFLVSESTLYRFDLSQRAVRKIELVGTTIKSVSDLPEMSKSDTEAKEKQELAVRTADSILVVNFDGELLRTLTIPAGLEDKFFELAYWSDGSSVIATRDSKQRLGEAYWVDPQGQVTRHETVQLLGVDVWDLFRRWIWETTAACPFPVVLAFFLLVMFPHSVLLFGRAPTFAAAISMVMSEGWLPLLLVCLLAVALVPLVVRRQRLYAERGTAAWVLLVLLLGPAGLIGYLVHRHWPVLRRCQACGATIPSDRLECAVCDVEMPLPARKGIEVVA